MTIPYTFAGATTAIPLANLDANFASPITLGNVAMTLSNTYTSIGNLTLTNVTISSASGLAANTVAYANASGVLVGSSSFVFDGTNVGIGTSSPGAKLDIQGKLWLSNTGGNTGAMTNGVATGDVRIFGGNSTTNGSGIIMYGGSHGATPNVMTFNYGSTETMRIDSSGNVGIGTSSPFGTTSGRTCMSVNGTSSASLNIGTNGGQKAYLFSDGTVGQIGTIGSLPIVFAPNDTERMRIDSAGRLIMASSANGLVGGIQAGNTASGPCNGSITSSASASGPYPFVANALSASQGMVGWYYNAGLVCSISITGGTVISYATTSDYRLKENIAPMKGALETISKLNPVTYTWKSNGLVGQGFIAHELQEFFPDAVTGEKDAVDENGKPVNQGVDTSFIVATLTAAIQEQQALIESLTTRLNVLESK